ncbi:MAG: threonyl-tRNA synthetase editing domain-containing protein [Deltaproteobacteria bacterium]|nr:threonyl-tRNA synthetase editing domain-containing protein [Deltaproteobacteria bacterium]
MRVLFWYCDRFDWTPAVKTLDDVPEAEPAENENAVVAFVHIEPNDVETGSSAETKLVKNAKWLARKWEITQIVLHSFTHLGEKKADPETARALLDRAQNRLKTAGYTVVQTPYGYFLDLSIKAPGHPLARVYKEL